MRKQIKRPRRSLPHRLRRRVWGGPFFLVLLLVLAVGQGAFAINSPDLVSSYPPHLSRVRSDSFISVRATYDRDLSPFESRMRLRDNTTALVPGGWALCGAASDTGGQRSICFTPTAPLTEAASDYTAEVRAAPLVPGEQTFTDFIFTIDDTAPLPPIITDPSNGQIRNDQPMLAVGTSEPAAEVSIVEGDDVIASGEVNELGQFSIELPYGLEDGVTHAIKAYATDEAGNKSLDSATVTFIHDSAAPQPPVILTPAEGAFLGSASVLVSGTAKPNTTVEIEETILLASTPADALGNWSTTIVFAAGTHTITATSLDGISPDGPSQGRSFTVDLTAPPVPAITTPAAGASVATTEVLVSGTAEPLATVQVREGALIRGETPANGAGAWSITLHFTEGTHTIRARAIDRAGNQSGLTPNRTFTVDTAAPPAATITSPLEDAFLSAALVSVGGAADPNGSVEVLEGNAVIATTGVDGVGAWSVGITFADGAHTIRARATDAAGNVGPLSAPRSFTVDTIAPATPVILEPVEGDTLTTATVTISGTGDPSSTITVYEGVTPIGTAATGPAGTWRVDVVFTNGAHAITAEASDNAGNVGAASPVRNFSVSAPVDLLPPPAPAISQPAQGSLQPGLVEFDGSGEAGATIRVFEGAALIGSATAVGGVWAFSAFMPSGPHAVTAAATDPAGNAGPSSAVRSFTVDAAKPSVSFASPDNSVFLPGSPTTLLGSATDGLGVLRVTLEYRNLAGQLVLTADAGVCTGCPGPSITWSASPSLPLGGYSVSAFAEDLVGNRSTAARITIWRL